MVAPTALFAFLEQIAAKNSSIGERRRHAHVSEASAFDQWIIEACKRPENAAPPAPGKHGGAADVPESFRATYADREWSRAALKLANNDSAAETPPTPKRARTGPAVDATTSPMSPGSPVFLLRSPTKVGLDKAFDRFGGRQGPMAAPSPCRAPRLGPVPLAPPPKEGLPARAQTATYDAPPQPAIGSDSRSAQVEPRSAFATNAPTNTPCPGSRMATPGSCLATPLAPVSFAQPSKNLDDITPPATPPPGAAKDNAEWKGNALFAPVALSPSPVKASGADIAEASARLAAAAQHCTLPDGALKNGRDAAPISKAADTSAQGASTPMSVSERVKMYETKNTPGATAPPPPSGNRLLATATGGPIHVGTGGTPAVGAMTVGGVCGGSARGPHVAATASGSKIIKPQLGSAANQLKPKDLFRSQSDFSRPPQKAQQPHSARGALDAHRHGITKLASSANNQGSASAGTLPSAIGVPSDLERSYERMAAGGRSGDVVKPKSLKAAEHAKQQEQRDLERKQRERIEREHERERERARVLTPSTSSKEVGAAAGTLAAASKAVASGTTAQLSSSVRKGRRSATLAGCDAAAAGLSARIDPQTMCATMPATMSASAPSQAPTNSGSDAAGVHIFRRPNEQTLTEAAVRCRHMALGPKKPEDNYELSEKDEDSGNEEETISKDRSHKLVPKWCDTYLQDLKNFAEVDPDTIFSSKVPAYTHEDVFTEALYEQIGKERPKRQRGSSQDWRKDRLTNTEVRTYKSKMGQVRSWDINNQ